MNQKIIKQYAEHVYKQLGFGFAESVYRKCLAIQLREHYNNVQEEYAIPVTFVSLSGQKIQVTVLRADIVIGSDIVIELKTLAKKLDKNSKEYLQLKRYHNNVQPKESYLINFSKDGVTVL